METVRDNLDHARSAEGGSRLPKKHLQPPSGERPREELNSTISIDKTEKKSSLGIVNVEGTEPQHAALFTVPGRICARPEDFIDSSVELLVNCGGTSDFMLMQTARRARLLLYKLTNPGHVVTA